MKRVICAITLLAGMFLLSNAFAASISINNLSDKPVHVEYIWNVRGADLPQQTNIQARYNAIDIGSGFKDYLSVQLQEVAFGGKVIECPGIEKFQKYDGIKLIIYSNGDCRAASVMKDNS